MSYQFANNAASTLAAGITDVATSITVATGQGALFPTPSGSDVFQATLVRASDLAIEIVTVTARSGDVMTVTRAQEGTTGLAFLTGDKFELRLTKAVMENVYQAGGTDVSVSDGGTGRSTGTTPYALIATGTTATGAQQTLEAGATTELLVGGGASALPVWTTATGSGSPVRATSPTLVTPTLGVATATSVQGIVGNVTPAAGTFTALTSTTSTTLASESVALAANNLPVVRPTLNLDFANSKIVDPRITFTRASTATRVNANGLIETVASGAPRIDYDPVTLACKGLLIEESRTNLLTYSEQFDNAAWTPGANIATVSANSTVAPDGTTTADTLTAGTVDHMRHTVATVANDSASYTFSVYLKQGSSAKTGLYLKFSGGTIKSYSATITWATLSIVDTYTQGTAVSLTSVGGGYYRATITGANNSSGNTSVVARINPAGEAIIGGGTGTVIAWGAQLEAGSFATSYVPTTSAQVTRAADVPMMTGTNFSSWYRQDEFTSVVRFIGNAAGTQVYAKWNDATSNEEIKLESVSGTLTLTVTDGGVAQAALALGSLTTGTTYTVAAAWKVNDIAASINGGAVVTDTSATLPTPTQRVIGSSVYVRGYPTRLANATLQALSTP